jgi:membrane protease YdiL (CAAX protease family)
MEHSSCFIGYIIAQDGAASHVQINFWIGQINFYLTNAVFWITIVRKRKGGACMQDKRLYDQPEMAALVLLLLEWGLSLLSLFVNGLPGQVLHYASYLVPIALFLCLFTKREEILAHRPTPAGFLRVLPFLPIFLAAVLLVSTVTGHLMTALGMPTTGGSAGEGDFFALLLSHALLPALLEEGLMRLCILTLLTRRSSSWAIPQSALLFALLHASLYQLPYAFVGGILLALVTVYGGSVLYAVLFHLFNNLLSLCMQRLPRLIGVTAGLYVNLAGSLIIFLLAAWGILVLLKRKRESTKPLPTPKGWLRALLCSPLLIYVMLMLFYTCL